MSEEKPRIVLALDPAESTGVCMASISGDTATIFHYDYLNVDTSSNYLGDWCNDMADRIEKIVTKYGVTDIAVEDFFFSSKFTTGVSVNPAYRTAIYMRLRQMGLPYTILNISQWKSFIAGRSVPTKEQKLKYGKQPSKKIFIQQALWEKYSIRFPNHSLSENTGKPIKFRYDIVDAVAQCICFCRLHLNVPKIQCTVQNPPDVAFKKPFKDQFAYPSV